MHPRANLRTQLASLALLTCATPSCNDAPEPWNALLITLDTTNANALGCYEPRHARVTPILDELAREALIFENARSVAPLTLPAHASMLTGLTPLRHSVRTNGLSPLPASALTLAELAKESGYQTAAVVAAVVLAKPFGLAQGFDHYDEPPAQDSRAGLHMAERDAAAVTRAALEWLAARDTSKPFFLWIHYFDAHAPYAPPERFREQAAGNTYLGEVAHVDAAIGTLLDALRAEDLFDSTLIAVVGDHGESLERRGEPTHSVLCYDETLRVPFIVRSPDGERAGERSAALVSVADVLPTFARALHLAAPRGLDGIALQDGPVASERAVYFESYDAYLNYGWSPLAGCVEGSVKYVHGTHPELFDLASDPGETRNVIEARPEQAERLRAVIASWDSAEKLGLASGEALDADWQRELAAMGYASAGLATAKLPEPTADTGLPDPRSRMAELRAFYDATLAGERGELGKAIEDLRAIVEGNPRNVHALTVLATFLVQAGRPRDVLDTLELMPKEQRDRLNVQDSYGHAFEALGNHEQALKHFMRTDELRPNDRHQLEDLVRVLERLGRSEELAKARERLAKAR